MTDLATAITDGHAAIIRPKISFEFFPPKTEEME
ncbi:MAG: methylenetetrahydrofolate reductase [NAD(P)H], partial [Bradyrhizobium sp.]|nr:methylenetetrahydrofolate reductase [NAD(P)H] [Bradyrhizobium sp.]